MLQVLPYKVILPVLGATCLPLIAKIVFTATGSHLTLQAYLLPVVVGSTLGFLLGYTLDKYLQTVAELKAANRALQLEVEERKLSEGRYAALFENNHSVILLIDPGSGAIVDANPAACSFYDYPIEQLRKMKIFDINILTEGEIKQEMALAAKERRRKFYFKHRLGSGEIRDVEVYSGSITLNGSSYLLSMINDITELKLLRGIIPICSQCKKIRDDQGYWNRLEAYIEQHSEADFSHGICPDCAQKFYPDLFTGKKRGHE